MDNPKATSRDPLHIVNVIPPDEYADHKTDSVYTNAVAILSLQYAMKAATLLHKEKEYEQSIARWKDVSERIVMVTAENDAGLLYHPEYAGYKEGTMIKQADTIMLGYPFEITFSNMTAAVRANDLDVYQKVSDNEGPAMTWGMFAIGYVEMGAARAQDAAINFNRSFANVHEPFNVWTETPTGGAANFLTGAGGFLQAAFFGYSQLRIGEDAITLKPQLPEATNNMRLRGVAYLGNKLDISYDAHTITFEARTPSSSSSSASFKPLMLIDETASASYSLKPGAKVQLPLSASIDALSTFTIKMAAV